MAKKLLQLVLIAMSNLLVFFAAAQNPFTVGNIVVVRVGDGTATLANTGNAVFLDEYTTSGTFVQSIALPLPTTTANSLVLSGTATSEGALTLSPDGQTLALSGYSPSIAGLPFGSSLSGTASATVNRIVALVGNNAVVNLSSKFNDVADANNPRGAVVNNGQLWMVGGAGGIRTAAVGASTSTQISTTVANLRTVNIFDGNLYVSTNSGTAVRIGQVGTGLPTATGQTITSLPGIPTSGGSPYAFALLDMDASVAGVDVLYVADDASTGSLLKYSLVGGTWIANGSITGKIIRGLTAKKVGTTVELYATTATEILKLTDNSGYNATITGTYTTLFTETNTNRALRGIAFAPQVAIPTVNVSISPTTTSEATPNNTVTITATASAPVSGNQTVSVAVSGTGITASDYSLSNTTLTIPNGQTTGTVTLTVSDDTDVEGTETATITISNPSAGITLGSTTTATLTIIDNDVLLPTVNVSIDPTTTSEATPNNTVTITATASAPVSGNQTVNVTVGGTNVNANDFTLSNTTLTILDGQTTGTVTLTILDDNDVEGTETATITISNPSAGIVLGSTTTASLTINDNDFPVVNLAVLSGSTNVLTAAEADANALTLTVTANAPVVGDQTVALEITGAGVTTADYTLSDNLAFTILNGQTTASKTITIVNDTQNELTEVFNIAIKNPSAGIVLGTAATRNLLVFDNDAPAPPTANNEISLELLSSYQNGPALSGTTQINSAEISAYDPISKRLFIVNSIGKVLNIVNMSNPSALAAVSAVDITQYGSGINSVAVRNGIVAVAIEATNPQNNGSVVFFNADGVFQKQVSVGAMPDMITFSPNGNLVLTANEGEPSADYTQDPEGSVSVIDISGGIANLTQANVTTAGFTSFNSQANTLRQQGVRLYGLNATVAQDLEPEYITFNNDGSKAYITLQENNAVAVLDIPTRTITHINPLGLKNHALAGNGMDVNDNPAESHVSSRIQIANYPVRGMYQPDAIAYFTVNNQQYLITANEGDAREYGANTNPALRLQEETRVNNAAYILDPTVFPNAGFWKNSNVLGRLTVTNRTGDTDGDGDFDEIHVLGARSFTIWQVGANQNLSLTYDSGDQIERITARDVPTIFNCNNTDIAVDNRSDNKGPEPEGVVTTTIAGKVYAFVSLERVGGILVYNVTNPTAPVFVQYINPRSTTALTGDRGAEGIFFIPAAESPNGQALLVVSNEISNTVSVFQVKPAPGNFTLTVNTASNAVRNTLTWTAATGATAYRVQRRTIGGTFAPIGNVLPGTTTTFDDNTAVLGTSYEYQVVATNDLGQTLSNISSAIITADEDNSLSRAITVSPNPTEGVLNIEVHLTNIGAIEYTLSNAQGVQIRGWASDASQQRINLEALPRGVYFLQINAQGKQAVKRIILK